MIDPMRPTCDFNIPLSWRTKIAKRWRELEPKVKWQERDPAVREALEIDHYSLLITLLNKEVEMRVIRRLGLDDMTLPEQELNARAERYLERRRRRRTR
jgi:hypothetical protein